jgi:hypothetical protein
MSKASGGFSLVNYSDEDTSDSDDGIPSPVKRAREESGTAQRAATAVEADAATCPASAELSAEPDRNSSFHDYVGSSSLETHVLDITASTPCDEGAQANISSLLASHGAAFVAALSSRKEFNNPYMLEKVSVLSGIDTFGTAFPASFAFAASDYYDALAAKSQRSGFSDSSSSDKPQSEFVP